METYINNDTLIENDVTRMLKSSIICPLCNNILITPFMCMVCQKVYCKKCIDDPNNKDKKCTCEGANYQKCIGKNDILSALKFTCVGCSKEIKYDEAQKHHDSCCPDKTSKDMKKTETQTETQNENQTETPTQTPKESKLKKLKKEEIEELKKQGKEVLYITGN